jgi:hypothetical protein
VSIFSAGLGVVADASGHGRKTKKPQERKHTAFNSSAFFRLEAQLVALCIIAGVRQARQVVRW